MSRISGAQLRRFCEALLRTQDLDRAGCEAGIGDPQSVLRQEDCRNELAALRGQLDRLLQPGDVLRRMAALAFGPANDCVRLVMEEKPELDKLDLSLLSEVKRSEKGALEVKLLDRVELLRLLAEQVQEPSELAADLLRALQGDADV